MKIGFVGLGNMGAGMASNLLEFCQQHNMELLVDDINSEAVERLVNQGASPCNSLAELAQAVEVLFTSLPSSREVKQVAEHVLPNLPEAAVWFETSTNQLNEWREVQSCARPPLILVDVPVTGGSEGAAAGQLTMLLGIDAAVLERFEDLLSAFTAKAIRMGPRGAGYVSKLIQLHLNYLVAQGIGEALMLGATR